MSPTVFSRLVDRLRDRADSHRGTPSDLQALHRSALYYSSATGAGPWQESPSSSAETPVHVNFTVAELRHWVQELQFTVGRLDRYLQQEPPDELTAVEGPFTGDARAAVATTRLWVAEASTAARSLAACLEAAHIAAGGLAERRQ